MSTLILEVLGPEATRSVRSQGQLTESLTGFRVGLALREAALDRLADRMKDGPRHAADLARRGGLSGDPLARVLRILTQAGVLFETPCGKYGTTPLGRLLESDRPDSMRRQVIEETGWRD
jgi:hypothetical protein